VFELNAFAAKERNSIRLGLESLNYRQAAPRARNIRARGKHGAKRSASPLDSNRLMLAALKVRNPSLQKNNIALSELKGYF
jgi:hypothetical protein